MVNGGIEGHKDIVRDVAWHPKRNEILTSSVSCLSLLQFDNQLLTFILNFVVGLQRQHQYIPRQIHREETIKGKLYVIIRL